MSIAYQFRDDSGNVIIPITAASTTLTLNEISPAFSEGQMHIVFYDDASGDTIGAPTNGTITPHAGLIAGQLLMPSNNATIDATTVNGTTPTYTPALFNGPATHAQVNVTGVTGVTHMSVIYFAGE